MHATQESVAMPGYSNNRRREAGRSGDSDTRTTFKPAGGPASGSGIPAFTLAKQLKLAGARRQASTPSDANPRSAHAPLRMCVIPNAVCLRWMLANITKLIVQLVCLPMCVSGCAPIGLPACLVVAVLAVQLRASVFTKPSRTLNIVTVWWCA